MTQWKQTGLANGNKSRKNVLSDCGATQFIAASSMKPCHCGYSSVRAKVQHSEKYSHLLSDWKYSEKIGTTFMYL